jgi:hypothetical protein
VWQAKTEGGMAPVERALILATLAVVAGLVVHDGAVRLLYEAAIPVVVLALFVGFFSGLPRWLRLASTVALTLVGAYIPAVAFGQQGDVSARSILSDAVPWTLLLLALPRMDPPAVLRRWSQARIWPWPIYFVVSAVLMSALIGMCLLITVVLKGREVPRTLVFASFLCVVASFLYIVYGLRSRRVSLFVRIPALLLLRPAGVPTDEVVQQISEALGARVLLVVLELEPPNRSLRQAVGRWGKLAFLGFEQIFLAVGAIAVIGLLLAQLVGGYQHDGELRHLHTLIILAVAAAGFIGRLSIMNWRVGRAVDRVRAKRVRSLRGSARSIFKLQMGQRVWREAIEHLRDECACLLIDLSADIDRLSWEIDHLKTQWVGRAVALLNDTAAIPEALKAAGVPIVRYSLALQAWQGFAAQLRRVFRMGDTGDVKEFVR